MKHSSPCRYTHTTPQHLISRLTARNMHLLALRISSYLHLKPDSVLKHWAVAKIAKSKGLNTAEGDDEVVCKLIVEKFRSASLSDGKTVLSVSYADIAKKAWETGRGRLATMVCIRFLAFWSTLKYALFSYLTTNPVPPTKFRCCLL